MVFGRTYCPISRLPIEDGDECMLIALDFSIKASTTFDVNNFTNLYSFAAIPPQVVVYGGNPSEVSFVEKTTIASVASSYDLNMLVHKKFYELAVTKNEFRGWYDTLDNITSHATAPIQGEFIQKIYELKKDNQVTDLIMAIKPDHKCPSKKEAEEWMTDLATFAFLVSNIGGMSPVSVIVDQTDRQHTFFEEIRIEAMKK